MLKLALLSVLFMLCSSQNPVEQLNGFYTAQWGVNPQFLTDKIDSIYFVFNEGNSFCSVTIGETGNVLSGGGATPILSIDPNSYGSFTLNLFGGQNYTILSNSYNFDWVLLEIQWGMVNTPVMLVQRGVSTPPPIFLEDVLPANAVVYDFPQEYSYNSCSWNGTMGACNWV